MDRFPLRNRKRFISFNKNLKNPPNEELWSHISPQLDKLSDILKNQHIQRLYLELIWQLKPSDRDAFLGASHAQAFVNVFSTTGALSKLGKVEHSQQGLKQLFEACIQLEHGNIGKEAIKKLFFALLEVQLELPREIPKHFLSSVFTSDHDSNHDHVIIKVIQPVQSAEELALHFTASVMNVLTEMSYSYNGKILKIEQLDAAIKHSFPRPDLEIHDDRIEITNWTTQDFRRFLEITEFPEDYYFTEKEWEKHLNPPLLRCDQRKMDILTRAKEQTKQPVTTNEAERKLNSGNTFKPLSVTVLIGLIKNNIHLKPLTWKSFDYHKEKLPNKILCQLWEQMEKASEETDIPESLKLYLEASRELPQEQPENKQLLKAEVNKLATSSFSTLDQHMSSELFPLLWSLLSQKELLMNAELELLAGYKDYMNMEHIVSILKRVHIQTEAHIVNEWEQLLKEKTALYWIRHPLYLELPDEVADYLSCY